MLVRISLLYITIYIHTYVLRYKSLLSLNSDSVQIIEFTKFSSTSWHGLILFVVACPYRRKLWICDELCLEGNQGRQPFSGQEVRHHFSRQHPELHDQVLDQELDAGEKLDV